MAHYSESFYREFPRNAAARDEKNIAIYQPRNPKASAFHRCVEDYFEQLETDWDDCYQSHFGYWQPYVTDAIRRYLPGFIFFCVGINSAMK